MMDARLQGLYHLGARDSVSKYELALLIAREMGHSEAAIERALLADAAMPVRRPYNTSVSPAKAEKSLGRRMPTVLDAVQGFVAQRQQIFQPIVAG